MPNPAESRGQRHRLRARPADLPQPVALCGLQNRLHDVRGDVRDFAHLSQTLRACRPDIVFHLAAQPLVRESYAFPRETYETNVMGTVNLLEGIRALERPPSLYST